MRKTLDVETDRRTDAELITALQNYGLSRRWLVKLFGTAAVVAALGGTAAAREGGGRRIDKFYGAPFAANETVPAGLVDHEVVLHLHPGPGEHEDFPVDPETGEVLPAEFFFDPVGLRVTPGDVVAFTDHNGLHTVTSIHSKFSEPPFISLSDRVPTANAFTSAVLADGDAWLYRFTTKGVYDLMCLPHVELGMVVRLVVLDEGDPVPADPYGPFLVPNAGDVFAAPELTPANIVANGTVGWDELTL